MKQPIGHVAGLAVICALSAILAIGCSCRGGDNGERPHDRKSGEESVDHSTPRASWAEIILEPEPGQVVLNHDTIGQVDQATGKLLWPALTCTLEDCPGQELESGPLLFPARIEGTHVDSSGQIVWPPSDGRGEQGVLCPECGLPDGVRHYEHPKVVKRKAKLLEELRLSREAYREARNRGNSLPSELRPPQHIIDEIDHLPRVFLIDE